MSTPIFRHLLKPLIAFQYVVLLILHHIKAAIKAVIYNVFIFIKYNLLRQYNRRRSFNLIACNLLISDQIYFLRGFSLQKLG